MARLTAQQILGDLGDANNPLVVQDLDQNCALPSQLLTVLTRFMNQSKMYAPSVKAKIRLPNQRCIMPNNAF